MGKFPQSLYTDTESDNSSSSNENLKKKRKPSILKYTSASAKKKKCKIHSISEPDDSEPPRARSLSRGRNTHKKLHGILKHTSHDRDRDRDDQKERYYTSSEEDDETDIRSSLPPDKFLVGRVPLPPGSKPGRGGGVALLVRKSVKAEQNMQPKQTSSSSKKSDRRNKRVTRKRSY